MIEEYDSSVQISSAMLLTVQYPTVVRFPNKRSSAYLFLSIGTSDESTKIVIIL